MHRTRIKRLSPEGVLLKRLREQRELSMEKAAKLAGKSISWISHVENGRMDVSDDHLELLLPLYGQTQHSFQSYLRGEAFVSSPARQECLDALHLLSDDLIQQVHPILKTLTQLSKKEIQ
jgi:transcriptional regulator with XRE-family HTH domain